MRGRLARLLRKLATWLEPEYQIEVYVRPVIVGDEDMAHTLRVLTQVECARLGLPPEWPAGKEMTRKVVIR
jgi:hypothetical protein